MINMYASSVLYSEMENECFPTNEIFVSDETALKIIDKLSKHYKTHKIKVRFWGYNDGGSSHEDNRIIISHNPSIYTIIHEFAHQCSDVKYFRKILNRVDNGRNLSHGMHYKIRLRNIHKYCKSRKFWYNINRRKT